jgi:phytoene/squalene synthetase
MIYVDIVTDRKPFGKLKMTSNAASATLAEIITRDASTQSYLTIKALVPPERRDDAFRAYAYYRWVDDLLDGEDLNQAQRSEFIASQRQLLSDCLSGHPPRDLCAEELLLVDLTQGHLKGDLGLEIYLRDMMDVMVFDVTRRGHRINSSQLSWYSRRLATAVSEAVYTFMEEKCRAPRVVERYVAADAAHITHMLRDMQEDLETGYINIPIEVIPGERINAKMLQQECVKTWVNERVSLARRYFKKGDEYLRIIQNPRCRMAGSWYATRFTGVLDAIEREDYLLRGDYSDITNNGMMLRMLWEGIKAALPNAPLPTLASNFTHTPMREIEATLLHPIEILEE